MNPTQCKRTAERLLGRTIVAVEWQHQLAHDASGDAKHLTRPRFILDDGTTVRFEAEESCFGESGMRVVVSRKPSPQDMQTIVNAAKAREQARGGRQ